MSGAKGVGRQPPRHQLAAEIGARIARHRQARRWQQKELAARAGFRVPRLSRLENGHNLPNLSELLRLRQTLRVSIDELVTGRPPAAPALLDAIQRLESVASAEELRQVRSFLEGWIARIGRGAKRGQPP